MKRWELMALIGGLAIAWSLACYAQQPQSAPPKRVGLLASGPCPPSERWWSGRLAELGWSKGTIVFDCVSTVGRLDELPALARELVSRNPDVLMAITYRFIRALKQETTTIPIVMLATWEPVRTGLVASLARPEGNITGVVWFVFTAKQIQLLKEIVPNLRRLALIGNGNPPPEMKQIGEEDWTLAASTLGFTWQVFEPHIVSDYGEIFARIAADHFDAALIDLDQFNLQNTKLIIELALRHRIPAVSPASWMTKSGLLLGYGQDWVWSVTRASEYVDTILRGAKPSDLPIEQATKVQLTINLKTARALGVTVPPALLARADEVIE